MERAACGIGGVADTSDEGGAGSEEEGGCDGAADALG
jgi:hypothetical protein